MNAQNHKVQQANGTLHQMLLNTIMTFDKHEAQCAPKRTPKECMKVNSISRIALISALFACSINSYAKQVETVFQSCDIDAYFIDSDRNGSNVRSAPSAQSQIINQVDNMTTVLHITGIQNGWFQVDRIYDAASEGGDVDVFKGLGWVHASIVGGDGVGSNGTKLFQTATEKSKLLASIGVEKGIGLISCKGKWAYVQSRRDKLKGWVKNQTMCTNPLSNCS